MFQNTNYSYTLYIAYLRASSYEPGNRAGSVTRTNSVVCSYGKFQPETGMNARNTNKMVEHNLYYSRQSEPCGPFNFINKAFSHTPEVEIRTRPKLIPFWPLSGESKAILSKMFRPGHRARVFIWENFHPGYRDLGRKNRDLGNQASPAPHMNTSMFLQRKE